MDANGTTFQGRSVPQEKHEDLDMMKSGDLPDTSEEGEILPDPSCAARNPAFLPTRGDAGTPNAQTVSRCLGSSRFSVGIDAQSSIPFPGRILAPIIPTSPRLFTHSGALSEPMHHVQPPHIRMKDDLRKKLEDGMRYGQYWSVTTMPQPFAAWSPLPSHQEMETRPCHCSKSRVHKLRCGHTVGVARSAEQCASNCVGSSTMMKQLIRLHIANPLPPDEAEEPSPPRSSPSEIYQNSLVALRQYAWTFLGVQQGVPTENQPEAVARANAHLAIMNRMNFPHQYTDRSDLIGGDFQCQECRAEGHRPTVPVYHYKMSLWHVIIPIRNEEDQTLVTKLKDGTRPSIPSSEVRRRVLQRGGIRQSYRGGRHAVRGGRDRVLEGRITRHRVEEKRRVLGRMKEEQLMESLEGMGIDG